MWKDAAMFDRGLGYESSYSVHCSALDRGISVLFNTSSIKKQAQNCSIVSSYAKDSMKETGGAGAASYTSWRFLLLYTNIVVLINL